MLKLRDYQKAPAKKLLKCVNTDKVSVDGSDMGTGKTYVNSWVAAKSGRPVFVVCPKVVIKPWREVLEMAGANVVDIASYQKLTRGGHPNVTRVGKELKWVLPRNCLIIFDESHNCNGWNAEEGPTLNGKLLIAAGTKPGVKVILASGTLGDEPNKFYSVGLVLGLHQGFDFVPWCEDLGCRLNIFGQLEYRTTSNGILTIREAIHPRRGIRITKRDLPEDFPIRIVDLHQVDASEEDRAAFDSLEKELVELALKVDNDYDNSHVEILRARQEAEFLKVPHLIRLTVDALDDGCHVAIFVNFTPTIEMLSEQFGTTCIVDGKTSQKKRDANIAAFQANEEPVILVNLQAGGVGLSLHDLQGGFPRRSLICPTFNALHLAQAVDRTHRNGAKTPSHSTIVCFNYGIEKGICQKVQRKLNDLSKLNDNELQAPYKITSGRARKLAEDEAPVNVGLNVKAFFGRR